MGNLAIHVDGISKCFRIGRAPGHHRLSELIYGLGSHVLSAPRRWFGPGQGSTPGSSESGEEDFWALRDVCFEVEEGEALGIIGRNGAGKSTLLKILSKITEPTEGRFGIRGQVGSLLEVGTGFHPELTGRENVFLNGAFLGMPRSEIEGQFDKIAAFSEIEHFLDTPVKRYSSGMKIRLGFAVAAHLRPEVLIVDEVLSVGDAAFQKKCIEKMAEVVESGHTILFVSHNVHAIERFCDRAILLEQGRVTLAGPAKDVVATYLAKSKSKPQGDTVREWDLESRPTQFFRSISVNGQSLPAEVVVQPGESLRLVVEGTSAAVLQKVNVCAHLSTSDGTRLATWATHLAGLRLPEVDGKLKLFCDVDELPLVPGIFNLDFIILASGSTVDRITGACSLVLKDDGHKWPGAAPTFKHHGYIIIEGAWSKHGASEGESP